MFSVKKQNKIIFKKKTELRVGGREKKPSLFVDNVIIYRKFLKNW